MNPSVPYTKKPRKLRHSCHKGDPMTASLPRGNDPVDPYRCVEDNASEPVQAWLRECAAESEAYFQGCSARQVLAEEFRKLFSLDTVGTPVPRKGRYFVSRRRGDQDLSVLYVQEGLEGEPRALI